MMSSRLQVIRGHLRLNERRIHRTAGTPSDITPNLRYTVEDCDLLSKEDKHFFEENGYFVVRRLLTKDQIEKFTERFQRICQKEVKVPGLTIMKDITLAKKKVKTSEDTVSKIQNFQQDSVLMEYCHDPQILKYAEAFVGKDIMAMHSMLINKPPDPGTKTSRHPLHQDLHYFPFRPADRIVASWTAMQHITRENGCLVVLPGTHKGKFLQHDYPQWEGGVNKMYHGVRDFDPNAPRVYLDMDVGDTVFFHPLLIHGSGTNSSKDFRKAISCHFASSRCRYIDTEGTLHEDVANEIVNVARKKLGKDIQITLKDTFYLKARLVQGERIHL